MFERQERGQCTPIGTVEKISLARSKSCSYFAAMTVAVPSLAQDVEKVRRERLFTVDQFYRLAEAGVLGPDHQRLELIDGKILEPMPIGPAHATVVTQVHSILSLRLGPAFLVRSQNPIRLSEHSEPLPDVSVVHHRPDKYRAAHPKPEDVLLVVEVSDTTLEFDLGQKARGYAGAGIVEYWVLDLVSERLRIFRRPDQGEFTESLIARRGQTVEAAAIPEFSVAVQELFG